MTDWHSHSLSLSLSLSLSQSPSLNLPLSISRTGTLKVGDKVLAINGESLYNKTVSDAVIILQAAGDVVTLKISKSTKRPRESPPQTTNLVNNNYCIVVN